jgi:hypothetical protein
MDIFAQLACAAVPWLADGSAAASGLQLSSLCAGASPTLNAKRVRATFGPDWPKAGDHGVRVLGATVGRHLDWEIVQSVSTRAGERYEKGLGADKPRGVSPNLRVLATAIGNPDRCLATESLIYTHGTRDDKTCARADLGRIASFEAECGAPIASTFAEHLELVFAHIDSARARIARASKQRRLSREQMDIFERCFPTWLILDAQPYGTPTIRSMLYRDIEYPGDDPETIRTVLRHGKHAVALCSPQTRELAERKFQGRWIPLEIDENDFKSLGLSERWGLDFSYLPDEQLLVRDQVDEGSASASGKCWKVIGFKDDLANAVALATVAEEGYPRDCLERARAISGWGLISMTKIQMHAALRSVTHLAYGALVSAERRRRKEELRRREPRAGASRDSEPAPSD